jgi:hypothetical protein
MKTRCFTLVIFCVSWLGIPSAAQVHAQEQAVTEVIYRLFKGMEHGDSARVKSCFENDVTMATVYRDEGGNQQLTRESSISDFLKAVGSPHADVWYEEVWDVKVHIDGDFAQVWCDYAFYTGHTFSHCGVDAFHLYRGKGGWKIFHLADTRRKAGCKVPEEIQKKHHGKG